MSKLPLIGSRSVDDDSHFRSYEKYKRLLLLRSDHPLGLIYSAKNLAKKVSRDQELEDKVSYTGPDKEIAILGGITIKLGSIGELHGKLLEEVKAMQLDLFGGIGLDDEWLGFKMPETLVDRVNDTHPGYCFLDEGANDLKKYEDVGLKILLHHPQFKGRYGSMVSDTKFVPDVVACHDFLKRASAVMTKIATLFHIGLGNPARGTESTSQYLRNHPQGDARNVKIINGELCLVGGYNKSSSLVRFLSESVSRYRY